MSLLRIAAIATVTFLSSLAHAATTLTPLPGSTPQTARPSSQWPMPIGVVATDGGVPVAGVQVTFAMTDPPFVMGNFNFTVATDVQGIAEIPADYTTSSNVYGTFVLQASEPAGANTSFTLTIAGAGPDHLVAVSGDNQSVAAGQVFPQRFIAQVIGTDGAPVPYPNVSFQPQPGATGTFTGSNYYTAGDANGIVTAPIFTAGATTGAGSVDALVLNGFAFVFNFTIVPAPPPRIYTLTPVAGSTPQTTRPNSFFPVPLGVVARNPDGTPAAGVDITFSGTPNSIVLIPGVSLFPSGINGTVVTTGADGVASAASPMSPKGYIAFGAGSAVITATSPLALNDVQFQLSASGKPPSRIEQLSGNGQDAPWGAVLAPWIVRAWDDSDQPVPYAAVFYDVSVDRSGASATFDNAQTDIVFPADARGIATSPKLVAGNSTASQATGSASLDPPDATDQFSPFLPFTFRTGPLVPPVGLHAWATPPLSIPAGASASIPFSGRLTDGAGHPLANVSVTFTTDRRCASFAGATTFRTTTDANGIATSLPLSGVRASTSCATSASATGLVLDLSVHVFDPARVVATVTTPFVHTHPDAFYTFDVQFTERGLPVHVPNFDIRSLHLGATYATTPVADIFDDTARLSFMANHQAGAYAIEFQLEGGALLVIPVVQAP